MRIGTADPWALTELAKAGGPGGRGPPSQGGIWGGTRLGGYFCLSVPWFVMGQLRAG